MTFTLFETQNKSSCVNRAVEIFNGATLIQVVFDIQYNKGKACFDFVELLSFVVLGFLSFLGFEGFDC